MEPYYYTKMTKPQQAAYRAMEQGIASLADSFQVPRLEKQGLGEVFFRLRLDHPEIFWAPSFRYQYYPDSPNLIFKPEYLFDRPRVREHQKAMAARVEKLARPAKALSPLEKERYIHDFICQNVRYDKLKKPYSHEILGPLGQGASVCEGIAKAVKALCDALGLWCIVVISENNPEKGIRYRHAWNIVKLGGQYFHLDATFDNSLGGDGVIRYDYFNLDDKKIFRDHEPILTRAPSCTQGDRFYYREKKLSFTKLEDVNKRALQAIRKKKPLIFHWRGGFLTREILQDLVRLLEQAGQEKGVHAQVKVNWPQAVLQAAFVPQRSGDLLIPQQANEGEEPPPPQAVE